LRGKRETDKDSQREKERTGLRGKRERQIKTVSWRQAETGRQQEGRNT